LFDPQCISHYTPTAKKRLLNISSEEGIIMGIMEGKVCVVTGGAGSLGLESARLLLQEGARVMLVGRNEENLVRAFKTLNASTDP
jgi:FlaA1/EpsC-like NDP-sugar epimerase